MNFTSKFIVLIDTCFFSFNSEKKVCENCSYVSMKEYSTERKHIFGMTYDCFLVNFLSFCFTMNF